MCLEISFYRLPLEHPVPPTVQKRSFDERKEVARRAIDPKFAIQFKINPEVIYIDDDSEDESDSVKQENSLHTSIPELAEFANVEENSRTLEKLREIEDMVKVAEIMNIGKIKYWYAKILIRSTNKYLIKLRDRY